MLAMLAVYGAQREARNLTQVPPSGETEKFTSLLHIGALITKAFLKSKPKIQMRHLSF